MTQKTLDVLRMFSYRPGSGDRCRYRQSLARTYVPKVWTRKIAELIRKGYVIDDGRGGTLSAKGQAAVAKAAEAAGV